MVFMAVPSRIDSPSDRLREAPVQAVIEDIVRGIGWGALRLVTLGRYAGGTQKDRLSEGALGFALVLGAMYAVYAMTAWMRRRG
jgi:hypothetical protein